MTTPTHTHTHPKQSAVRQKNKDIPKHSPFSKGVGVVGPAGCPERFLVQRVGHVEPQLCYVTFLLDSRDAVT